MTVSIVFEVHASEDEPIHEMLQEIQSLPTWDRELMTARIMRWEADRRAEQAAGAIALRDQEERRTSQARATRARNRQLREAASKDG